MMEKPPYEDAVSPTGIITRTFHYSVDSSKLKWHQDEKNRNIFVVESGGWLFQSDGQIPFLLEDNSFIYIKEKTWHRVIKGHGTLIIKIYEK